MCSTEENTFLAKTNSYFFFPLGFFFFGLHIHRLVSRCDCHCVLNSQCLWGQAGGCDQGGAGEGTQQRGRGVRRGRRDSSGTEGEDPPAPPKPAADS